jgi:hypothetical protein
MKINNKYIKTGDSADEIIGKANFNFDQILSSGFGGTGFNGPKGITGVVGRVGPDGNPGATGLRSTDWFQQNTAPATAGKNQYDYWINTSNVNQDQIYEFVGPSGWIDTGYSLRTSGVFTGIQSLDGPEGATGFSAIAINATGPQLPRTTFVFSDRVVTPADANPNLAKVLVSTDSSVNTAPILAFSKTTTNSPGYPSFYWGSTGQDYTLSLDTSSDFSLIAGRELSIYTPGSFSVDASVVDLKSGSTFAMNSSGNITITSDPSIQISSSELNIGGNSNSINVPAVLNPSVGNTGSFKIDIQGNLFNTGLAITSAGATSGNDILKVNDPDEKNLLRVKQNSQSIIGVTGSTGAHFISEYLTVQSKFIPTSSDGSITYGFVDLSSPQYFETNKIYLEFPSGINSSYADPRFFLLLPSPVIDEKICGPGEIAEYQVFNGGTGFKMNGIRYMEKRNVGNNSILLERNVEFPNPGQFSVLTLTFAGDRSSLFYSNGITGGYLNMDIS